MCLTIPVKRAKSHTAICGMNFITDSLFPPPPPPLLSLSLSLSLSLLKCLNNQVLFTSQSLFPWHTLNRTMRRGRYDFTWSKRAERRREKEGNRFLAFFLFRLSLPAETVAPCTLQVWLSLPVSVITHTHTHRERERERLRVYIAKSGRTSHW